jgi:hypothetical protein
VEIIKQRLRQAPAVLPKRPSSQAEDRPSNKRIAPDATTPFPVIAGTSQDVDTNTADPLAFLQDLDDPSTSTVGAVGPDMTSDLTSPDDLLAVWCQLMGGTGASGMDLLQGMMAMPATSTATGQYSQYTDWSADTWTNDDV